MIVWWHIGFWMLVGYALFILTLSTSIRAINAAMPIEMQVDGKDLFQ